MCSDGKSRELRSLSELYPENEEVMRTGIWIPEWINDLGLRGNLKQLYAEIVSLHKHGCFASNAHFAKVLGLKEDTVSKMISTLKKNGFLLQSAFDGRKRTLVPLKLEVCDAETEKTPIQTRTKVQSRVGEFSNPVQDFLQAPCTRIHLNKKEIKNIKGGTDAWEKFLNFTKSLSISTSARIRECSKPEDLPPDLRFYYDRFEIAA